MRHFYYVVVAVLAFANSAQAITLSWNQVPNGAGGAPLAGFITSDLIGNFTANVRGQELLVILSSGSLYNSTFGGNGPPNGALIPVFPDLAFDSFVGTGGLVDNPATNPLLVGPAVDIPGSTALVATINASGADITWAPAPGRDTGAVDNFFLARMSASNNANGTWALLSSDDSTGEVVISMNGPVINGVFAPEPAFGLMGLLSALLLGRIRRS